MYKRKLLEVVIFWTLLTLTCRNVQAGPMKRLSRMAREVYPEIDPENEGNQAQVCIVGDVVYGADEPVPAEQPCLKCRCQPPGVQCETLQCEKRPGCKAIHKPNKCCPDYQCECEHDGKIYANGEKLETPPGGECKVCYCRGGEVQCAEVSCYMRKDCEGKRVPGQCCPKYDHCPPIDPLPGRPPFTTEITPLEKEGFEPWPISGLPSNATDSILNPTSNDIQDDNKIPDINEYETTTGVPKATEVDDLQKEAKVGLIHKITIQEIIPERKEIPITAPPKSETEPHGTLIIEEADEPLNNSNDLVVTDSDADSSEISEIFRQPPPVLRIGDKLLFLKKGEFISERDTSTPNSVITIIGAEGLQRGFEDSGEVHEVKIENLPKETVASESNLENFEDTDNNSANTNNLELNTAYSTHILSLVKRKNKPSTTTEVVFTTESETIIPTTDATFLEASTLGPTTLQESTDKLSSTTEVTSTEQTTLNIVDSLTTEEIKNSTETPSKEVPGNSEVKETIIPSSSTKSYEPLLDNNPAYPPLPESMGSHADDTSQRFDLDNIEKNNTDNATISHTLKILSDVLGMRSNKTVPQNISNNEWLKKNPNSLINYQAILPDELLNQPAPSDSEAVTETDNDVSTISEISVTTTSATDNKNAGTETATIIVEDNRFEHVTTDATTLSAKTEENPRSVETIEDTREDSGETTTKKNSHASIISNENASIENKDPNSSEAEDMVSTKNDLSGSSGEETTPMNVEDSGIIDKEWTDNLNNTSNENSKDVEIINTSTFEKKKPIERNTDVVTEEIPETTTLPEKILAKRENSLKELYDDLNAEVLKENSTSHEDQQDSDVVFKDLLESTSTTKPAKDRALNKEPDSSMLGTLIKLINSQYQSSSKK